MTGIVVVSHSRALAQAAVDLAREMAPDAVIVTAAGLDDGSFGTDAMAIMEAVLEADGTDAAGVVVLMDLGSAVLSAEMAVEMLDPDIASRVVLSPAPLVEGLVVAAVAAAAGAEAERIAAEARAALTAKEQHLGVVDEPPAGPSDAPTDVVAAERPEVPTGRFTVTPPTGIHARPAALLVAEAAQFAAGGTEVLVRNLTTQSGPARADSMLELMTLGAQQGHEVEVTASGPDADRAVAALVALAERNFDE